MRLLGVLTHCTSLHLIGQATFPKQSLVFSQSSVFYRIPFVGNSISKLAFTRASRMQYPENGRVPTAVGTRHYRCRLVVPVCCMRRYMFVIIRNYGFRKYNKKYRNVIIVIQHERYHFHCFQVQRTIHSIVHIHCIVCYTLRRWVIATHTYKVYLLIVLTLQNIAAQF